jgi:hypothetical protein
MKIGKVSYTLFNKSKFSHDNTIFSEYMIVNNFNVCYKNRLNSNITHVSDIKKQLHFGVKAIAEINAAPPKL